MTHFVPAMLIQIPECTLGENFKKKKSTFSTSFAPKDDTCKMFGEKFLYLSYNNCLECPPMEAFLFHFTFFCFSPLLPNGPFYYLVNENSHFAQQVMVPKCEISSSDMVS